MNARFGVGVITIGALLIVAASLVYGGMQHGYYGTAELGSIQQAAPAELSADPKYEVTAFPSYGPELAAGEGRQETLGFCSTCHSSRYITMQPPLPADVWEAEVKKMMKAYGAPIPDATAQKIVQYLQAHYTPETRKP